MSCSCTCVSIWARPGSECTSTRILSGMTSSQAGTCHSPASALATMNGVISSDFAVNSMMSFSLHLVRGDVHLAAVDPEVPVRDKLAGHVPALGEPGPVDHVVEAALQDPQQVLTGLAALAGRLLVVIVELPLKDPVDAPSLLLLPDLEQVLVLLGAVAPVLTRRVRPDLDGALG